MINTNIDTNEFNKHISKVLNFLKYILLIILAVIYLWPLVWIFAVSLRTNEELLLAPFVFPEKIIFENYEVAWNAARLGKATFNSGIVTVLSVVIGMFFSCIAAFALGRMKLEKISKVLLIFFVCGMMIPLHCIMVPIFKMFALFDWTDSRLALVLLYIAGSLPQAIFILTGFFRGMNNDLFEAACIDGCSIYALFFRIALPLSRNGLFVVGLMNFVGAWNELLESLVLISDKELKTLPVAVTSFVGPYTTNYTEMFAAIIVSVLPTIIVYSFCSNSIVDGLTQGAIKS